ncbi:unnamed protein product [Allacma fusca]|uniref:Uncharacterized protein n=1 Tax=Allacma fusca TaxID=39272 RepID=A0A8J2KUM0_9HEXA|nr:unnamed protein product [Allacma fusca]
MTGSFTPTNLLATILILTISKVASFNIETLLKPFQNCMNYRFTNVNLSPESEQWNDHFINTSFSLLIPLFLLNGRPNHIILNIQCLVLFADMNIINNRASFNCPEYHKEFKPYDMTSEFIVLTAVTNKPVLKMENNIPTDSNKFHENIIGLHIAPSSGYRITRLYHYRWYCKDSPSCIEASSPAKWYPLMTNPNVDHNWFIQTQGDSFNYKKNYHLWPVEIGNSKTGSDSAN